MKRREYGSTTALVDLTTNMLLLFVALFTLAYMLMNRKLEETKKINSNAEFIITVTWPKEVNDDVDTYVEDPLGNIVFFQSREKGLMHLDRDDLGKRNDKVKNADGTLIEFDENKEIVTLRGVIPGEYIVNTHMFRKEDPNPIDVSISLEKLNPYSMVVKEKVVLYEHGNEETAFRFTLDDKGLVTSINKEEKEFAGTTIHQDEHYRASPADANPYAEQQSAPPPPEAPE